MQSDGAFAHRLLGALIAAMVPNRGGAERLGVEMESRGFRKRLRWCRTGMVRSDWYDGVDFLGPEEELRWCRTGAVRSNASVFPSFVQ